jgi:hypothetical protein
MLDLLCVNMLVDIVACHHLNTVSRLSMYVYLQCISVTKDVLWCNVLVLKRSDRVRSFSAYNNHHQQSHSKYWRGLYFLSTYTDVRNTERAYTNSGIMHLINIFHTEWACVIYCIYRFLSLFPSAALTHT